jgi:hypothetical protein
VLYKVLYKFVDFFSYQFHPYQINLYETELESTIFKAKIEAEKNEILTQFYQNVVRKQQSSK